MQISFSGNVNDIINYLSSLKSRAEDKKLLEIGQGKLNKAIPGNLWNQVSPPDSRPFLQSDASVTEGRRTMIDSEDFYKDLKNIANYQIEGFGVNVYTTVHADWKGEDFFYGAYWNERDWPVAGLVKKDQVELNDSFGEYILNGKVTL
jgi:hypothetical protein